MRSLPHLPKLNVVGSIPITRSIRSKGRDATEATVRSPTRKKTSVHSLASRPVQRPRPRVGRNDPCPCGSGRKFKRCHGGTPDENPAIDGDAPRASERLLQLAEPWLDACEDDDEHFLQCLRLAMMAWNIATIEAVGADTAELRAKVREMGIEGEFDELARRKSRMFPEDLRHMLDVTVTRDHTGGRYVKVLTTK